MGAILEETSSPHKNGTTDKNTIREKPPANPIFYMSWFWFFSFFVVVYD